MRSLQKQQVEMFLIQKNAVGICFYSVRKRFLANLMLFK